MDIFFTMLIGALLLFGLFAWVRHSKSQMQQDVSTTINTETLTNTILMHNPISGDERDHKYYKATLEQLYDKLQQVEKEDFVLAPPYTSILSNGRTIHSNCSMYLDNVKKHELDQEALNFIVMFTNIFIKGFDKNSNSFIIQNLQYMSEKAKSVSQDVTINK